MSIEFLKRLDPELPFYYHTATDRFYEGPLPEFDEPSTSQTQCHVRRPPRRELMSSNLGRRLSVATRGRGSLRATYHPVPVDYPPVPHSFSVFQDEHSYSANTLQ